MKMDEKIFAASKYRLENFMSHEVMVTRVFHWVLVGMHPNGFNPAAENVDI